MYGTSVYEAVFAHSEYTLFLPYFGLKLISGFCMSVFFFFFSDFVSQVLEF